MQMALVTVRTMNPADFAMVAEVDRLAFSLAAVRRGGEPLGMPRHAAGLEYFRQMAPDLCHVAVSGGEIVGYSIGHRWGKIAWIGPLGVSPSHMGQGIGTILLDAFSEASVRGGAATIGLETSLLGNIQLYERRGYEARCVRLLLAKPVSLGAVSGGHSPAPDGEPRPSIMPLLELEPGERVRLANESLDLAGRVAEGVDHRAELTSVPESGMGETLVALDSDGHLTGYAALYLHELRAPEMDIRQAAPDALVWLMVGWPAACRELVLACERRAAAAGLTKLRVPCYGASPHGFALLRHMGYMPEAAFVRMIRAGNYPGSAGHRWGTVPLGFSAWLG
jgi:predicted N-acetyltransferase YhbS